MDLKQLSYFLAIAEEGTISGAARRLNMSQPPLSTQMRLLEEEVGCLLFRRGSRKIELTEAGRMLCRRAQDLLELSDLTRQELTDYKNGTAGTLRLGVVSSVGSTLLQNWILDFHTHYPAINFDLAEADTYQLLEQLGSNLIELAIIRTPFAPGSFTCLTLKEEQMMAVGHAHFFQDTISPITLSALSDKPLIIYRRWETVLNQAFEALHIKPHYFCRNEDARTTAIWADSGCGIGIIPASAKHLLRHPDTYTYTIDDPHLHTSISVVYKQTDYMPAAAKAFIDHLLTKEARE